MVSAGSFFELELQLNQKAMGQERLGHLVVPAAPRSRFILIQPDLAFAFFERRLNRPAPPTQLGQVAVSDCRWRIAKEKLQLRFGSQTAAQHQPHPRPRQLLAATRQPSGGLLGDAALARRRAVSFVAAPRGSAPGVPRRVCAPRRAYRRALRPDTIY